MKKTIILILMLCLASASWAQQKPPYPQTTATQVLSNWSSWFTRSIALPHGATPLFPSWVPDSLKKGSLWYSTTNNRVYYFDQSTLTWNKMVSDSDLTAAIASVPTPNITGGTILKLPSVGDVIPTGTPDQVWNATYRPVLPPTATLTGGSTRQYSNADATVTLNYSYGRQATTNTIATVFFNPGGINKFSTQPAQPGTVSGTQTVNVLANVNTTYTLTVTATGGLTAVATTAVNWLPFYYVGTCAGTTPTASEVLAATTKTFGTGTPYNMNFTFTGANLHVFYAYYSSYPTVTSVKDAAGNQAIAAMTLSTVSITDNGFTGTWKTATTNNTYTNANIVLSFL